MKLPRRRALAPRPGSGGADRRVGPEVPVDHRGDVDELARGAERRRRPLGVGPRRRGRRPVRHQDARSALGADRLGDEVRDERGVDPARQPEDGPLEAGLAELAADELADDPARDVGVDRELVGQLEGLGVAPSSIASAASPRPPAPAIAKVASRSVEARWQSRPGSASGSRGRIGRQAGPLGDDPRQLADLELRPLVAQQRQGDPLAADVGRGISTRNRPSS